MASPPTVKKTAAVWALLVLVSLQALVGALSVGRALLSQSVLAVLGPSLLYWLVSPLLLLVLQVLLVAALLRLLPRPQWAAPALGALWWLHGTYHALSPMLGGAVAASVILGPVPPVVRVLGMASFRLGLLLIVAALFVQRATRAYLRG